MKTISLRALGALGTWDEIKELHPTDRFLEKSTEESLEKATRDFACWWESAITPLPLEQNDAAGNAINQWVGAQTQDAYESGVRTGFQLAMDILSKQTPGRTIEHHACGEADIT